MLERLSTNVTLDQIFDDLYNLISEANRIPLTDKIIVEESDLSAILDDLKEAIPKEVKNVIKCRNPRCITSIEQELPHIFFLADEEKEIYRCKYCEEKFSQKDKF